MRYYRRGSEREIWKGLVAGFAGGLAATFVMTEFQNAWSKVQSQAKSNGGQQQHQEASQSVSKESANGGSAGQESTNDKSESDESATDKAANKISEAVFHRELSGTAKKRASYAVHYAFGTLMGGLYGAAAEFLPQVRSGFGLPFATAVFLGGDELAVPALGLSKPVKEYPLSRHLYGLASHLVYGASVEAVRRGVRAAID